MAMPCRALLTRPTLRRWMLAPAALGVLFLVVIPVIAELTAPSIGAAVPAPLDSRSYRVFVADWGYHTSIIVERPPGARLGPEAREGAPFVEYAWGDRRFYMAD